jgi:uncharacterized delta-60 repeat protein
LLSCQFNLNSQRTQALCFIDSEGRIVVGGYAPGASNTDFVVVRYEADGDLDTEFSGDGIVTTPVGSSNDFGRAVAIDSQDRIIVAGHAYNAETSYEYAVVRYQADGDLDSTFSGDGKVTTPVGSSHDYGYAVTGLQMAGVSEKETSLLVGATPEVIRKHYERMDRMTVAKRAIQRRLAAAGSGDAQNPTAPILARPLRAARSEALDGQKGIAQDDVA